MSVSLRSAGGGATPRLIIQAVFDDKDFMTRMDAMIKGLGRMETAILKMTEASIKADDRRAVSAAKTSRSITRQLRALRWELVSILFFVNRASRLIVRGFEAMGEAAEAAAMQQGVRALAETYEVNMGRVLQTLMSVSDGTLSVKDAHQVALSGMLQDQGYFSEQYAELWEAARVAAVTSGADAQQVFAALVEDLVKGTGAATDAITPIFGLQRALEAYALSTGKTVRQLGRLEAAQVILNQVQGKSNELLEAGADEALRTAGGFERLTAAVENFGTSTTAMTETTGLPDWLAKVVTGGENVTNFLLAFGAGLREVNEEAKRTGEALTWMGAQAAHERGMLKAIQEWGVRTGRVPTPTGGVPTLPERPLIPVEGLTRMTSHFLKYEEIMKGHIENRSDIWQRFFKRQQAVEDNFVRNSTRINRRYDRTRDRATRNATRRESVLTADGYRRLAQLREKYEMRIRHFTQTFNQRELQNLAMFQYERGRAVAEGDVLAVEDMDARYELESKAREENAILEKEQMRERYDLQQRYLKEAIQIQIDALREALREQLNEIEIRRKEQLDEEETSRQENLDKANTAREEQLLEEDLAHEKSLEKWAAYWRTLAEKAGLGSEEMAGILRFYFGEGGEANKIIDVYLAKLGEWERLYQRLTTAASRFAAAASAAGSGGPPRQRRDRGPPDVPWERGYQQGGQFIANRPTSIMVGEGYAPELVTITPLRGGGAMSLRWEGGPIQVQGSGSLAGMDTQGMGDSIAQGIMVLLQEQFGSV